MTGWLTKFLTELMIRASREVTGSFWQTRQRKAQEKKALSYIVYDAKGKADQWPWSEEDSRNEVTEDVREKYLRTFGRDGGEGMDAVVRRLEYYQEKQRPEPRPYGVGPGFVEQMWGKEIP